MELFHKILKTAVAVGASDVHLKVGTPVVFRVNRELLAIECPNPTHQWMSNVVEHVAPPHLKPCLEQDREIDFPYFVPGIGRFRTNLFQHANWSKARGFWRTLEPFRRITGGMDTWFQTLELNDRTA